MEYEVQPPGACGGCLMVGYLVPMPVKHEGRQDDSAPRRRGGVVRASTLRPDVRPAPYGEPWSAWKIGMPHIGVAFGPPGVGKSTLVTHLAMSAARQVPVLLVAVEEGHAGTLSERLKRCGLDDTTAHRISISDARSLPELAEDVGNLPPDAIIVVDSLTDLRCKPDTLGALLAARSWWATQHVTTGGAPRGGLEASHQADIVVEVRKGGIATPRKNRWGAMDEIEIFPTTEAA